ncbi:hypothetical protein DLAC_04773 [Tieghemostelium lacteum]|uniref:Uncharacterized protein n=1 Tax=Tieghemostelium lacteum TaxID=361077 RepID=A0A151ZL10_TIELA|nr:hypothetical protein DLAC_04773 [Tieghemostelium lacteum]|eukprot:KYQ94474.1 hypothetical protein DLAC_04773 [Tieghemostelium lacteum]
MISAEDFNLLQEQLIELKRYKYEQSEREKKYLNEIKELKEKSEHHEELPNPTTPKKKTSLFSDYLTNITKDKGKLSDLQEENDILKKTIQQNTLVHQEQSEALQHNVKSLFETNSKLEDEIKQLNKDIQGYTEKLEEQKSTIHKLQFDIAESYSNNNSVIGDNNSANNGNSLCSSPNISSVSGVSSASVSSANYLVDSDQLVQGFLCALQEYSTISAEDKEDLKSKLLQIQLDFSSNSSTPSTPQSSQQQQQQPKEIIFHPLGEPVYNPEEEKEKTKLRDTIKNLMDQIRELDIKYQKSQQLHKDSSSLVSEFQEKHKQAELKRVKIEDRLGNEIKSLKENVEKLEKDKVDLKKEKEEMETTQQNMVKKLSDQITQLSTSMKLDQENFDKAIQDKIDEIRGQKLSFERQIEDLNDKANIFKMSRDEYLDQFNKTTQELVEKEKELEVAKSRISDTDKELLGLKDSFRDLQNEHLETKTSLDSHSNKSKKFQDQLAMERSSFDSLNEKFNLLNSQHLELEKKCQDVEKELAESQKDLNKIQEGNGDLQQQFNELTDQYKTQQVELENLQGRYSELENAHKEAVEKLVVLDQVSVENENLKLEISENSQKLQRALESLNNIQPEFEKLKLDNEANCQEIVKLKVEIEDAETEKKIAEKKNLKMIKDLKMELSKERENLSQSFNGISLSATNNSQSLPSSPMLSKSASSVSLPTTPQMTPLSVGSGGGLTPKSQVGTPHKTHHQRSLSMNPNLLVNQPPVNIEQLKHDFELMGKKLGEMGNEKYKLEEKIRSLETNVTSLNQELDKKTKVVRFYISKTQLGRATTEDEKSKRMKGGVLGSFWRNNDPNIVAEMVEKMETMLQENILKNIQLSDNIEMLGDESVKLRNENIRLKSLLESNNINSDDLSVNK